MWLFSRKWRLLKGSSFLLWISGRIAWLAGVFVNTLIGLGEKIESPISFFLLRVRGAGVSSSSSDASGTLTEFKLEYFDRFIANSSLTKGGKNPFVHLSYGKDKSDELEEIEEARVTCERLCLPFFIEKSFSLNGEMSIFGLLTFMSQIGS